MSRARSAEAWPIWLAARAAASSGARASAISAAFRRVRGSAGAVCATAAAETRDRTTTMLQTDRLFMVKRLRRVQARCAVRRYRAENHCDGTRKEKRQESRDPRDVDLDALDEKPGQIGQAQADAHADRGAHDAEREGLEEELAQDVAAPRPHRHAHADLPRPLLDRGEKDVHDPHAADHHR